MSKRETLDYLKLCSNYYSSWEDGTCMESCEYYNHNECPVVYVNGLITELKEQLALTKKALELACEEMIEDLQFDSEDDRHYTLQENIEYFKTMAKKEIKDNE